MPWLGSVPVLGALFSSKSYQQNQTDLAIIVTPHLVRPARPGDVIRTPADDTLPPNDADFFLLGKTEVTRAQAIALTPVDGARRRRRRPSIHRAHARSAEEGFRCGHPVTCCARSRSPRCVAALAGCSEYLDRRDTISLNGGNSVATNEVTQMVDPWPRGQRRQATSRSTARRWKPPSSAIAPAA